MPAAPRPVGRISGTGTGNPTHRIALARLASLVGRIFGWAAGFPTHCGGEGQVTGEAEGVPESRGVSWTGFTPGFRVVGMDCIYIDAIHRHQPRIRGSVSTFLTDSDESRHTQKLNLDESQHHKTSAGRAQGAPAGGCRGISREMTAIVRRYGKHKAEPLPSVSECERKGRVPIRRPAKTGRHADVWFLAPPGPG